MPKGEPQDLTPKDGEHIFPATRLTALALEWQKCNSTGEADKAHQLLEEIIKGSTVMFERFAQHEGFDSTVDLPTLVLAAQEKVVKWLLAWRPEKGKLFSWFSQCAKNVFKGEVVRANTYRTRIYSTSDSLEKFHGAEDHESLRDPAEQNLKKKFADLTTRWGSPQEIGCIRFLLESILSEEHDKRTSILAGSYAFGISLEMSKFFYNWVLFAMRNEMYEMAHVPFTEQDLLRHAHSYTHIPDLLEIVTWAQFRKIVMMLGGQRLKIPTSTQLSKLKDNYDLYRQLESSDKDPSTVEAIARRKGRTTKSAKEVWDEMSRIVRSDRSGEHSVFEDV